MDYEKKYKKTLERAKTLYENANGMILKKWLEQVFPELKESEDERIRKAIKQHVMFLDDTFPDKDSWLAWLEKQGEQTNFPQFTFDDVLALQCCMETAKKVQEDKDLYEKLNNLHGRVYDSYSFEKQSGQNQQGKSIMEAWKDMRLEVYQQASGNRHEPNYSDDTTKMFSLNDIDEIFEKIAETYERNFTDKVEPKFHKGEWLCENEPNNYARFIQILEIVNVQGKERYRISRDIHNDEDVVEFDFVEKYYHKFDIKDAKNGDALLFEGYYNSIVLFQGIGINGKGRINYHCKCDLGNYSFGVQGDVACLGTIEKDAEHYHPATKEQRDTLFTKMKEAGYTFDFEKKELKNVEQPKLTEFEDAIKDMMDDYRDAIDSNNATIEEVKERAAYMLSLIHCKHDGWSEEDERNLQNIDSVLFHEASLSEEECMRLRNWLQSIKEMAVWKPSEEQIEAFEHFVRSIGESGYTSPYDNNTKLLYSLLSDLKKL